jgi:prepilin-type N-terminal cleavage/methylation domain-containing protein
VLKKWILKRKFKKHRGFTLVEVMVSMGLLSVIMLGVTKIMDRSGSSLKYNKSRNDLAMAVDGAAFQVRKQEACQNNFVGNNATANYTQLVDEDSNVILAENQQFGSTDRETITLTDIATEKLTSNTMNVVLTFDTTDLDVGIPSIVRRIPVYAAIDGTDTVTGCFEVEESMHTTIIDYACLGYGAVRNGDYCYRKTLRNGPCPDLALNPLPNNPDGFVTEVHEASSSTDFEHQSSCVDTMNINDPGTCSGTEYLVGFDSFGNKVCMNFTNNQAIYAFEDTTLEDCTGHNLFAINTGSSPYGITCSTAPAPPAPAPASSPPCSAGGHIPSVDPPYYSAGGVNWGGNAGNYAPPYIRYGYSTAGPYVELDVVPSWPVSDIQISSDPSSPIASFPSSGSQEALFRIEWTAGLNYSVGFYLIPATSDAIGCFLVKDPSDTWSVRTEAGNDCWVNEQPIKRTLTYPSVSPFDATLTMNWDATAGTVSCEVDFSTNTATVATAPSVVNGIVGLPTYRHWFTTLPRTLGSRTTLMDWGNPVGPAPPPAAPPPAPAPPSVSFGACSLNTYSNTGGVVSLGGHTWEKYEAAGGSVTNGGSGVIMSSTSTGNYWTAIHKETPFSGLGGGFEFKANVLSNYQLMVWGFREPVSGASIYCENDPVSMVLRGWSNAGSCLPDSNTYTPFPTTARYSITWDTNNVYCNINGIPSGGAPVIMYSKTQEISTMGSAAFVRQFIGAAPTSGDDLEIYDYFQSW